MATIILSLDVVNTLQIPLFCFFVKDVSVKYLHFFLKNASMQE